MSYFSKLAHDLFLGKHDHAFYTENRSALRHTNYDLLRTACIFSTGMCTFLFLLTLLSEMISGLRAFYLLYTLLFAVQTALVLGVVRQRRQFVQPLYYVFAISIFTLVIDVGTRWSEGLPAVTFYMFLIIIPILYVSRPLHAVCVSVIACIAFCVATALYKGALGLDFIWQYDVLNAICACVVGIGLDVTIINLHLGYIESRTYYKRQSTTDELTTLANRRRFNLYIDEVFQQCIRRHTDLGICILDIDDFKLYNDTYGHLMGDDCLRRVSWSLKRVAKEHGAFLARFGGEEFVAVMPLRAGEALSRLAESFVESVLTLNIRNERSPLCRITLSVGYASLFATDAPNYMELLNRADESLYAAKAAGKNCAKPCPPKK